MQNYPNHTCNNCEGNSDKDDQFSYGQLLLFYTIALPSFIVGVIGLYSFSYIFLISWGLFCVVFFLVIEIRVLCSHCPNYNKSEFFIRCRANIGAPKLWKYRPKSMNIIEKIIMLAGFAIVWGSPAIVIAYRAQWLFFGIYLTTVIFFFIILGYRFCSKCANLTCPLNRVR